MLRTDESLDSLLPASYFSKHAAFRDGLQKDIISPPKLDHEEFLNAELGQGRLHELVDRLWIAGKPTPPNALHFQRVLGREIVGELNTKHTDGHTHERFMYDELRRSRLSKLLSIRSNFRETTYVPRWYRRGEFFCDNFAWLASATLYIAIVLTAMQLGLGTDVLAENAFLHSASYGFTVFTIVGPLAAAGLIIARYVFRTAVHNISADRAYRNILKDGEKGSYSRSQHW